MSFQSNLNHFEEFIHSKLVQSLLDSNCVIHIAIRNDCT